MLGRCGSRWFVSSLLLAGVLFSGARYESQAPPDAVCLRARPSPTNKHPLAKYLELVGFRMSEAGAGKIENQILRDQSLRGRYRRPGIESHAHHDGRQARRRAGGGSSTPRCLPLGPEETKDVTVTVPTKLRIYELPDWQFLRAVFEITSPAPNDRNACITTTAICANSRPGSSNSTDGGRRVYLDRTAFYPTSGGQPFDLGTLGGVAVREVMDEEDRIAHVLDAPLQADRSARRASIGRAASITCSSTPASICSRPFCVELYGIPTLSFHMGAVTSTIESACDAARSQAHRTDRRTLRRNHRREPAGDRSLSKMPLRSRPAQGIRARPARCASSPSKGWTGAPAGARTSAPRRKSGRSLLRKLEKIRGNVRMEFVCGLRAFAQARRDFRALSEISRLCRLRSKKLPRWWPRRSKGQDAQKSCQRLAAGLAARRQGIVCGRRARCRRRPPGDPARPDR